MHLVLIAIAVIVVIAALYWAPRRDTFVSEAAYRLNAQAKDAMAKGGYDSYTKYREHVDGADPVQYEDVRELYAAGRLTPETAQAVQQGA